MTNKSKNEAKNKSYELVNQGKDRSFGFVRDIKDSILGNSKDYYGEYYATEEVKKSARITCGTVIISNVIDGTSVFPLLSISFGGNVPLALITSVGLTIVSNYLGAAATSKKKGNESWSFYSLMSLIAINTIMSATALVAPELTLNKSGIAEVRADELIEIQQKRVDSIVPAKALQEKLNIAKSKCKELEEELKKYPKGSVQRDDAYVKAHGKWGQRDLNKIPEEIQPWCIRVNTIQEEANEIREQAQTEWNEKKARIAAAASPLTGIKIVLPELYSQNFDESGEVRSGTETARIAIEITYSKLMKGELMQLGFSLLIFSISVITSAASVLMVVSHNKREDVQMSFDEQLSILEEEYQRGNIDD